MEKALTMKRPKARKVLKGSKCVGSIRPPACPPRRSDRGLASERVRSGRRAGNVRGGRGGGVWCCGYTPDAALLVAGCSKGCLSFYDATGG